MKFIAEINIMPHKELLDPQGKAVVNNLKHLDLSGVADVRIGRHVTMVIGTPLPRLCDDLVRLATEAVSGGMLPVQGQHFLQPDLHLPESV